MDDGNDGNVELSLGLSVGGNSNQPPPPLEGFVTPDPLTSAGDLSVDGGVSPLLHPDWRREYQARRRKEARLKHEQKLLRRGIVRAKSSPILTAATKELQETRNVREPHRSPAPLDVPPTTFPMMPAVPISYPTVPLVPHVGGGYAIPCMVPFWAPVVPNTVQLRPPQSPQPSFVHQVACTPGKGVGSLGKTTSDVSQYHNRGGSKGSSNTKTANSSIMFTEKHTKIPRGHSDHNISYHQLASPSSTENKIPDDVAPSNSMFEPADKPDIVAPQPEKQSESEMPEKPSESEMPHVATVGDRGKVITGFLSRFTSEEEVTIMCKCHGTNFTPAEFVKHAGGSEIEQPMKHIRVVPRAA